MNKPLWAKQPSEMTVPELTQWAKAQLVLGIGSGTFPDEVYRVVAAAYSRGYVVGTGESGHGGINDHESRS